MHTALAPELRRGDGNPPVAATKVVQQVAGLDVGHLQHRVDDGLTRRHVNHVGLSKALLRRRLPGGAARDRQTRWRYRAARADEGLREVSRA